MPTNERIALSVQEAAAMLGVSKTKMYELYFNLIAFLSLSSTCISHIPHAMPSIPNIYLFIILSLLDDRVSHR